MWTAKKGTFKGARGAVMAALLCMALLPVTAHAAEEEFVIENGVLVKYNNPNAVNDYSRDPKEVTLRVVIPDGVTSIGPVVFSNTNGIAEVVIPEGVTSIGHAAFSRCQSLRSVTLPDSLTSIGDIAFRECPYLTNITLGSRVKSLGNSVFSCTGITQLTIPDSVTEMGTALVSYCENLTDVTLSNGMTSIPADMFAICPALTRVTIPDCVTSIGMCAFTGCTSLENITLPEGLTDMGVRTFMNCTALTRITIPESVTSIGHETFYEYVEGPYGVPDTIVPLSNLTICGAAGSYAETFAKEEGHPFAAISGKPVSTGSTVNQPSSWAEAQVNAAIAANLVPQALQTQYTQATTRGEFCALAVTLYETVKGAEITRRAAFLDTTDLNVQKMAGLGVVNGVGNGSFAPDNKLSREQAATMLARLAEALGTPLTAQAPDFTDNAAVSSWAFDAVGQVQSAGIMGGVGGNAFDPQGEYTREQSILTAKRLLDLIQ